MPMWKLTDVQLIKIKNYSNQINDENPHVKFTPNIINGVLLGVSVRFLPPKSWSTITSENARIEEFIYGNIEKVSRYRLFPERNGLFRNGILELEYSCVDREVDEQYVIAAMEFLANNLIDILTGEKKLD